MRGHTSHTRLASCLQRRALSPFGNRTKEDGEVKSKPTKAKLGEKSSFYYDEAVRAAADHQASWATSINQADLASLHRYSHCDPCHCTACCRSHLCLHVL